MTDADKKYQPLTNDEIKAAAHLAEMDCPHCAKGVLVSVEENAIDHDSRLSSAFGYMQLKRLFKLNSADDLEQSMRECRDNGDMDDSEIEATRTYLVENLPGLEKHLNSLMN